MSWHFEKKSKKIMSSFLSSTNFQLYWTMNVPWCWIKSLVLYNIFRKKFYYFNSINFISVPLWSCFFFIFLYLVFLYLFSFIIYLFIFTVNIMKVLLDHYYRCPYYRNTVILLNKRDFFSHLDFQLFFCTTSSDTKKKYYSKLKTLLTKM